MNRPKAFTFFVLALGFFLTALTLKFNFFFLDSPDGIGPLLALAASVVASGLCFGGCLHAFSPGSEGAKRLLSGVLVAIVVFLGVAFAESFLSAQVFETHDKPEDFAVLTDHCGVNAGRTLLKLIHAQESGLDAGMDELRVSGKCRMRHLGFVLDNRAKACNAGEDPIECLVRWMGSVAEHGYWNRYARKFFFTRVLNAWNDSKKEEALSEYAQKDLELESARASILKQAGLEESISDHYLLIQQKDELEQLKLTKEIFDRLSTMIQDTKVNPPPYLFKFKEAQEAATLKLAKIPEIEHEIKQLESGEKGK